MNRSGLWVVSVVVAAWIGFLLGYAMSSHSGAKPARAAPAVTGGYGKPAAGGYGKLPQQKGAKQGVQETK